MIHDTVAVNTESHLGKNDLGIKIEGFECVRCLGRGGFATTYLYSDLKKKYGELVAVKVPHDKATEEVLIQGDAVSLAILRQIPNIVRILEIKQAGGRYVLIMEYVDGPLLSELLNEIGSPPTLSIKEAIRYVLDIAQGLAAAHQRQLVHRDIKPENIIIDSARDSARILDFGIASIISNEGCFRTVNIKCTLAYTPLEVLEHGKGDCRVDIYALGMVFYRMVTGTLPYYRRGVTPVQMVNILREEAPQPPVEINPAIPRYVNRAIMSAINPDLQERCQSMEAFMSILEMPPEIGHARRHMATGAVKRAERVLQTLLNRLPEDSRGYAAMAALLSRCRRHSEAIEMLLKAIEIDPYELGLHLRLGTLFLKAGNKEMAARHLKKAMKLGPDKKMKKQLRLLLEKTGRG